MDWQEIVFTILMLILLTFIIYIAAGIASGDWDHSGGTWLRIILVAAIAAFLIPALQAGAALVSAQELGLLIAFIVIMFLIYFLVVPELTVADEWMTTIFASFLTVFVLYIVQRIVEALFDTHLFSFI